MTAQTELHELSASVPDLDSFKTAFTEAWFDLNTTVEEIKARFGMGNTSLYRHVFVYGLPKRPLLSSHGERQLRDLFCHGGKTVERIAEVLGCRPIAVTAALEFHGLLRQADRDDETSLVSPSATAGDDLCVQKILGHELRVLRRSRRWTRSDLLERLESDVSLQTLGTYELGIRKASVTRIFELCLAMDEQPAALIERVQRRVFVDGPSVLHLDLRKVADDERPELVPLRNWAVTLLLQEKPVTTILLEEQAFGSLSELCGIPVVELEAILSTMIFHRDS